MKLWYFRGRGKAEIIRFALGAAGVEWDDCYLCNRAAMEELLKAGKLLYDQVPMLELPDGKCIVQTNAILRYIAEEFHLNGTTPIERAEVDMLVEGAGDFLGGLIGLPFEAARSGGQPPKDGLSRLKYHYIPRYCGAFESNLASKSDAETTFMVGKTLSIADTSVLRCTEECVEWLGELFLASYPNLAKWRAGVLANPNVKLFMSSPHRQPSPAKPEVALVYCQEVGNALGR